MNAKTKLYDVFSSLKEGMLVFTNGDGDYDSDEFFFGTIVKKTTDEINIKRDDGDLGEGIEGSWIIKNSEDNPALITVFDKDNGKAMRVVNLKLGMVFSIPEGSFHTFIEHSTGGYVFTKPLSGGEISRLMLDEQDVVMFFFKHPSLLCSRNGCTHEAVEVVDGELLCKDHFKGIRVTTCENCGMTIRTENAHAVSNEDGDGSQKVCQRCYHELQESRKIIHNYSYKPEPQFIIGNPKDLSFAAKIMTGLEEEVECPGDSDVAMLGAEAIKLFLKKKKWFYLKTDGSIGHGFELVTHPANLEGHYALPWLELGDFYKKKRIRADDTTTCGLHVHTNKNIMTDDHQLRLAYFINSQRDTMEVIARRPACNWAKFKRANHPIATLHKSSGDKYEALNWLPQATVEFRLFKGTINPLIVLATIEFVHAVIMFTKNSKLDDLKDHAKAWRDFYNFVESSNYQHLPTYLKERGIR